MSSTVFFRLLTDEDKATALGDTVDAARQGESVPNLYATDSTSFWKIPGSPFAYWVSDRLRRVFSEVPRFESSARTAKQGLATADDFRFVRAWWEVKPGRIVAGPAHPETKTFLTATFSGCRWAPFAKGGAYSPFHGDVHLLVDWSDAGKDIREFDRAFVRNEQMYFRSGLTWSLRSQRGFSARAMACGCIFAHKGPSVFVIGNIANDLLSLLAIMNSASFRLLLDLQMAFGSYEVGVIQRTPVPTLTSDQAAALATLAQQACGLSRDRDRVDETTHVFALPTVVSSHTSSMKMAAWHFDEQRGVDERRLQSIQQDIDEQAATLYGLTADDLCRSLQFTDALEPQADGAAEEPDEEGDGAPAKGEKVHVENFMMWSLGCALGRWDVRIGLDQTLAPKLQGPFDPLPVCSPGMLVGTDGLQAKAGSIVSEEWLRARPDAISLPPEGSVIQSTIADTDCPLRIDWDGILVDDPDHLDDIVHRVREVLHLLWDDRTDGIEAEAVGLLGVRQLRDYFRNPRCFFEHHVKRYSKSRRKAPIYWLLQSPKRNYAIWLYYHRLDPDILFKSLVNYVEPKIRLEEDQLRSLTAQRQTAGVGSETKRLERAIDQQEALLSDLHEFRDRLDRAARLHLRPDLDDGVLLNIAPLWELVPWKEAKRTWEELLAGKYEWSAIGKQLRERGLV